MGAEVSSGLIILFLAIVYFVRRQRHRGAVAHHYKTSLPVKHRPMEPLTGLDFQMRIHMDIPSLYRLHRRYGKTFQVGTFVSHPAVVTIATENLKEINTSKVFGVEPMRLAGMETFCGRGFITTDGETWKRSRRLLKPSFERSNLQDLSILSREVDSFLERLTKDGSTVDLQLMLHVMFSNSALSFILGPHPFEVSASAPLTPDEFVRSFHDGLLYSMFRTVLGRAWNILPQAKYINACVRTHKFIDYYVEKMFDDKLTTGVINNTGSSLRNMQSLMQALSSQTNDRDYIRYQVIQGLMAAQDTTSELLTNSFFLLARHPKYWERLRTEVTQQGNAFFQVDKFTNSTLIRNVLLETLRLYPIFPLLGRIALQDTQLPVSGGSDQNHPMFIPKGTMVIMSYYAVHRNNAVFGNDIDAFRPDRWESIRPSQWEFYGFGAGYRACLGQQKAMIESSYVLVRMAYALEKIQSRDSQEWKGELKLTCKSAHGCKAAFN